jgi:exodeoxyribonuclease VII small subunit
MTDAEQARYAAMTFEQLVATLEEITERMASGQIGIEEAADLYEQAERLHGLAAERLARVQARIDAQAARHSRAQISPTD